MKATNVFVTQSAREEFGIAALEALACGLLVMTTSKSDNLAQHLAVWSSRSIVCNPSTSSIVCNPSTTGVAAAVKQLLAESGARSNDDDGIDESWLAEYSWQTVAGRVAEVLVL